MTPTTLPTAEPVRAPARTPGAKSYGPAAARLMTRLADGVDVAMPWQKSVMDVALELTEPGEWRYRVVIVTVPRQNGKTAMARGVIPHRLMYRPGRLVLATAQDLKLARRLWLELTAALESATTGNKVFRGFGSEEITMANGSGYLPVAPSPAAGHGLTLDLAYVDEAWRIEDERLSQGMEPALMVRHGQLWVVSTAGHDRSVWLRRLVEQGRAGTNPSVCLIEYAAPDSADPADPATWAMANPALGYTLTVDELASRFQTMDLAEFERAHLNRWTTSATHAIPPPWWAAAGDPTAAVPPVVGRVALALDLAGDRAAGSIAIAGIDPTTGRTVAEVVDHRPGTDWLAARALQLWREWRPAAVYLDPFGPANTVADELDRLRVPIVRVNAGQLTAAAAGLYDALRDDRFRHRHQPLLDTAADGAVRRTVLDRWAFSRGKSPVDISPLTAVSLARYALTDAPTGSTTIRVAPPV